MTKTLDQLRAEAYAAFAGHQRDMKSDPTYKRVAKAEQRKQVAAAKRQPK